MNVLAFILLIASCASFFAGMIARKRRSVVGSRVLFGLVVASGLWATLSALHILVPDVAVKIAIAQLQYVAIESVPLFWLLLALAVTARPPVRRSQLLVLSAIPLITVALAWTNQWHGLIWSQIATDGTRLTYNHGPAFWVAVAYNYILLATAQLLLAYAAVHGPLPYRVQQRVLFVVGLLPWLGNLMYLLQLLPFPGIDLTPLAFTIAGLLTLWALSRHHLLDLVPIARSVLIDHMTDAVIVLDQRERVVDYNQAAGQLTEIARSAVGLALPVALPEWAGFIHASTPSTPYTLTRVPGCEDMTVEIHKTVLTGHQTQPIGWLIVLRDVTALRTAEQTLRSFFDSAGAMMGIVELVGEEVTHISANLMTARFFHTTVDQLCGQRATMFSASPDIIQRWRKAFVASIEQKEPVQFEYVQPTPSGEVWLSVTVTCIGMAGAERTRFSYVVTDTTAQKRIEHELRRSQQELAAANAQLRELAQTDGLTGLRNRAAFDERLGDEVARTFRYPNPLSLLLIDIDHFKRYNDTYGHLAGDQVLRTVAQIFQEQTRQNDFVARFGGEEFAILLPNTDAAEAELAAERVRHAVERARWSERQITISIGVATLTTELTPTDLIHWADTALYRAKDQGRNQVQLAESATAGTNLGASMLLGTAM